jgi:outer membrane protein TolC
MSFAVASISAMGLTLALVHGEPEPVSITIDGLVTQALAANPELKFYKAEIAVAKATRSTAGRLPNPQLDLDVGYSQGVQLTGPIAVRVGGTPVAQYNVNLTSGSCTAPVR